MAKDVETNMRSALLAAAAYFLVAIVLGFALGLFRVTFVAPRTGSTVAVLLELPVMLAATWLACRAIVAFFKVGAGAAERLVMGGVALTLVLLAEGAIAASMQGRSPAAFVRSLGAPEGALGLGAQALFALFPWLQARTPARK